jgi:hypothetical protein
MSLKKWKDSFGKSEYHAWFRAIYDPARKAACVAATSQMRPLCFALGLLVESLAGIGCCANPLPRKTRRRDRIIILPAILGFSLQSPVITNVIFNENKNTSL